MEQFRQVGEAMGSLRALMVFRDDLGINQRQCALLFDAFNLAFDTTSQGIRKHLRFEERHAKWKPLEGPLRELHRVLREGEHYIRQCLDPRDWWGRALALSRAADCVHLHLHNLLWCVPVVLEAIEAASEASGGADQLRRRRVFFSKKYEREWMEPELFRHRFGDLYLVSDEMCRRAAAASREDHWVLSEMIAEKRGPAASKPMSKQESRLADLLVGPRGRLHPSSVLVGSPDYQVRRRLGSGTNCKEVQWMGESFALKHEVGEAADDISLLSSVDHPNVMSCLYAFSDEEKKERFVVTELMCKDLSSYIKEVSSPKRRVPFPLLVAVDAMLQIARGMEYLHSRKIYHGELNPSNILVKARGSGPLSSDAYFHAKVANLGHSSPAARSARAQANPCIWYAPEVLTEDEEHQQQAEKADVYSFAMICFQLLTGKIPFEESHLQGDKMSRNIKAGERPLFPFPSPKYLVNLTKRCWHADPAQRPSFASICRVLRYTKRFLVMNPEHSQLPEPPAPPVDYFEIEAVLSKRFEDWGRKEAMQLLGIPFQMFAYRVVERERTSVNLKERSSDSGSSDGASACGDENEFNAAGSEDSLSTSAASAKSVSQVSSNGVKKAAAKKAADVKAHKQLGQYQRVRTVKPI